jgi:hypoxanthine phosphoribosyltransferase
MVALLQPLPRPAFAHASEAELARILDFYQVRWTYEPDTFPIGWALTGEVIESFSPDFYLPDLDLYVELTTLKQKLVRKKNRKLRRLRELYPDVRIKLFYARDFRMLLLKFGRLALLDDLSGTPGQATPPRPADRIVTEAGAAAGLAGFPDGVIHAPLTGETATTSTAAPQAAGGSEAGEDLADDDGHAAQGGGPAAHAMTGAPRSPSSSRGRRRGRRRRRDRPEGTGSPGAVGTLGQAATGGPTGLVAGSEPA